MLNNLLIGSGLALIPFFALSGMDTREPKMMLMIGICLILNLSVIFRGLLKPVKNRYIFILIGYLFLSYLMAPKPDIILSGIQVSDFWAWQPLFIIFICFTFFLSISSIEIDRRLILIIMVWVGIVMSLYVIVQYFYIDQFYTVINQGNELDRIGGSLGNRSLSAAFIAFLIPISLYLKKYKHTLIMILAVIISSSSISIISMFISSGLYFMARSKARLLFYSFVIIGVIVLVVCLCQKYPSVKEYCSDHGRYKVWKDAWGDISSPLAKDSKKSYPFTGLGLGSFKFVFHLKHDNGFGNFLQAHNDYVEILYNSGLFGIGLFLLAIGSMFKTHFYFGMDMQKLALLSSFVCIALNAFGLFVWQSAPIIFYTLVIVGLIYNNKTKMEVTNA